MSPVFGNLIVIAVLAVVVFFAARSVWRSHKSGGCSGCGGGSCAGCSKCSSGNMIRAGKDHCSKES